MKMRKIYGIVVDDLIEISNLLMLAAVAATKNTISKAVDVVSTCKILLIPSTFVSGQRTR
jgi:hypothetical protein